MSPLISLALTIAPEIAHWLSGSSADATAAAVSQAVSSAAGTADADAARDALQRNPEATGQLKVQLAQIAAEQEKTARQLELDQLTATLRDTADARNQTGALSAQRTAIAWSAPVISALVLLTFGVVLLLVMVRGMPAGSETASNMLLGTLAAMATSVVSYWVGSSAGSARKDDRLAQFGK